MAGRDLSPELAEAGAALLATTDSLAMQAQGAMWLYDHALGEWRYYLVTSLVDTLGRRKTYKLLIEAFEKLGLPRDMNVDDVHLGSPNDPLFKFLARLFTVSDHAKMEFKDCKINDVEFDGLIYRSVDSIPPLSEASRIEKLFSKRVRDLAKVT